MSVYCVFSYTRIKGVLTKCLISIFDNDKSAESRCNELNKKYQTQDVSYEVNVISVLH